MAHPIIPETPNYLRRSLADAFHASLLVPISGTKRKREGTSFYKQFRVSELFPYDFTIYLQSRDFLYFIIGNIKPLQY